jgi:hypothetical protein
MSEKKEKLSEHAIQIKTLEGIIEGKDMRISGLEGLVNVQQRKIHQLSAQAQGAQIKSHALMELMKQLLGTFITKTFEDTQEGPVEILEMQDDQ